MNPRTDHLQKMVRDNSMVKIKPKIETREVNDSSLDSDDDYSSEENETIPIFTSPINFGSNKSYDDFELSLGDYYIYNSIEIKSQMVPTSIKFRTGSKNIFGVADKNGILWIYNIQMKEWAFKIKAHFKSIVDFDWNTQSQVITASNKNIRLWNINKQQREASFQHKSESLRFVKFDPRNNEHFVAIDSQGEIYLYNTKSGKSIFIQSSKPKPTYSIVLNTITCISWNSHLLITGDYHGWIEVFLCRNDEIKSVNFKNTEISIRSMDYHPETSMLVVSYANSSIKFYTVPDLCEIESNNIISFIETPQVIKNVKFTPGGNAIVCATENGHLFILEIQKSSIISSLNKHNESIVSFSISDGSDYIVSSTISGEIILWIRDKKSMLYRHDSWTSKIL